jgi:hypothetical protein
MFRGEKFVLDIDDEDDGDGEVRQSDAGEAAPSPFPFVGDVLERKSAAPTPPSAPTLKSRTGFPEHKKRPLQSRFKQRKQQADTRVLSDGTTVSAGAQQSRENATQHEDTAPRSWRDQEKSQIDKQNRDVLAGMSEAEIAEARAELLGSLDADLIQKLLARSNIDSGSNEVENLQPSPVPIEGGILQREKSSTTKQHWNSTTNPTSPPPPLPNQPLKMPLKMPLKEKPQSTSPLPPNHQHSTRTIRPSLPTYTKNTSPPSRLTPPNSNGCNPPRPTPRTQPPTPPPPIH